MRPIPTIINGTTYRSRVEARWAVMLEHLFPGRVEYEPFDADGYIPDFAIMGDSPLLVEVKAHLSLGALAGEIDRIEEGIRGHWTDDVLVVGGTPFLSDSQMLGARYPVVGLMGEMTEREGEREYLGTDIGWITHRQNIRWDSAVWARCGLCERHGWFHEGLNWNIRPCDHYDGDHFLKPPQRDRLNAMWSDAREQSRWTPA